MQLSPLESKVLETICVSLPDCTELAHQVRAARVIKRDYTGVGFYTDFEFCEKVTSFDESIWKFEDMPKVYGEHPSLSCGAGFILWCKSGIITCLEGYTYEGEWPNDEQAFSIRA